MSTKKDISTPAGNSASHRKLRRPDLIVILRGADDLNQRGGPELLAQVLKGETNSQIRKLGLESSPVFGALEVRELPQILERIQQAVQENYLALTGIGTKQRLSLTNSGWEIEYEIAAAEMLADFDAILDQTGTPDLTELFHTHPEVQLRALDLIESSGNRKYSSILAAWGAFSNPKLRIRIEQVLNHLESED